MDEQASARTILLILVFFLLGIAGGAFWVYRSANRGAANTGGEANGQPLALSDSTKTVLKRLESPVEIRFYSVLDPASVSDSLQAFAWRVDQLLSEYQQEAGGKIKVTRYSAQPDFNAAAAAAAADGIQAFNLDKGEGCYLGLTVTSGGQKVPLPRLAPEWEQALEADLTRAIEHVAASTVPASSAAVPPANTAAIEAVKRALPNLDSVSVEEGTRILREQALNEFKAAAGEMDVQVKEAQQRLVQAQNGGSAAEQQAAMKHFQQVQAEQTEKLKQIAAQLQNQIAALRQLKAGAP